MLGFGAGMRFRAGGGRIVCEGSADILVCGFWGLSSPQFHKAKRSTELESSGNPQAGKPALPALGTFQANVQANVSRIGSDGGCFCPGGRFAVTGPSWPLSQREL